MEYLPDHTAWAPLEKAVSVADVPQFMFMGKKDGICLYKHTMTRQYLNIDENTGDFYQIHPNGSYRRIHKADALAKVGLNGVTRCIVCDGTKMIVVNRPMAMYQGMPTRVVVGRCNRCDANGMMLPAPATPDFKTEASHDR